MKIACFADTHKCVDGLEIPESDVVICAGDFCNIGSFEDIIAFNTWFKDLPAKHKIVIAGNHDVSFENNLTISKTFLDESIIYLQDELIEINGTTFYGSPWQLPFNNWAFNLPEDALHRKFDRIPDNIDVLITHSPPYGILDSMPTKRKGSIH